MNILNKLYNIISNFFFGTEEEQKIYSECETSKEKQNLDELEQWLKLEDEKQNAIKQCKGCRDQVFVLKDSAGEEIGYYPNLSRLAISNNFPKKSVYRAFELNKQGSYFYKKKEKYNIVKLD